MSRAEDIAEAPDIPFEDFRIGQRVSFDAGFSAEEAKAFARLSGDWNPLHTDAAYAERSPYRRPVVHGLLVASLLSRVAGMHFPGRQSLLLGVDKVVFHAPTHVDEPLRCEAEILDKHDIFRILTLRVRIFGAFGRLKCSAEMKVQYRPPLRTPTLNLEELMQTDMSQHVVLITGASRGIGASLAEALGRCRARVVVNYHRSETLAGEVARRVEQNGGKALALQADVSSREQVRDMVRRAAEALGPVTMLVNNATSPVENLPFEETSWDLVKRDLDVHLGGAFHCMQEVLPGMARARFGRIVSVLTVYLRCPPPRGVSAYVAAKSALMGLTRCIATEYGAQGITANMIAPSMVETDLNAGLGEPARRAAAVRVPVGRLAEPSELLGALLLLLAPQSTYLNGALIDINGGLQF